MGGLLTGGPSDIRKHHARLLTGGGVDVVVAEENLRSRSAGSAVLGHVIGTDVDCGGSGLFDHLDGGSLAVGTVRTGNLTLGTEDAAGLLAQGEFVPGKDLVVRQPPPHGGETLENALDLGLVRGCGCTCGSSL